MSTATSTFATTGVALGDPVLGLRPTPLGIAGPTRFLAADLDGDGSPDLVDVDGRRIHRGLGTGAFEPSGSLTGTPEQAVDVDGDRRIDLLGRSSDGRIQLMRNLCTLPDLWVPAVVSVSGVRGARYETEITLTSSGIEPLALELRYVPSFGGGAGAATLTVPAGGQVSLRPALDALAGLGVPISPSGDRGGALAVLVKTGHREDLSAIARVVTSVPGGRVGVGFAGVPLGMGFTDEAVIGWLRETEQDRSNLAVLNLGGELEGEVTVRLTVLSTDPLAPGSATLPDVRLAPGQLLQVNRVLRSIATGTRSGFVRVKRVAGSAAFWAYGVVNDEGTADGSYVAAFDPARLSSTRLVIPAVVESGRYASDLVVTNTTAETRTLSFRFVSETLTTVDRTARFSLDVPAGGQVFVPDLVDTLRRQGVAGVGPRGIEYVGALFAELSGAPTGGVFLGVRTGEPRPEGRTGVFYEAIPERALAKTNCEIPLVRSDETVRSSVAIVNAGETTARFGVWVRNAAGSLVGARQFFEVGAGRFLQIDSILKAFGTGLSEGIVGIGTSSSGSRFLAYGVINDGAEPGSGTDDGTYVPMTAVR